MSWGALQPFKPWGRLLPPSLVDPENPETPVDSHSHQGSGTDSTVTGDVAVASAANTTADGDGAQATNTGATAVGTDTLASGSSSGAFIWGAIASGANAISFAGTASGDDSWAGEGATASATGAVAFTKGSGATHARTFVLQYLGVTTAADQVVVGNMHLTFTNLSSDPAGATDEGRIFFRDSGAGKMQACIRFPTGAVQVLAAEL